MRYIIVKMLKAIYSLLIFSGMFWILPNIYAQQWTLKKDKDGIQVYTRDEPGNNNKAFKGETEVHAGMEAVSAVIENVELFDDWDEDIIEIRLLEHQPGKLIRYYVVYDVPWPFQDRDLCVEAVFSSDNTNGIRQLKSKSIPNAVPEDEDIVRIENYWQCWTLSENKDSIVHITVEGFADPAGDIPAWIANMAITESPLNMLENLKKALQ